MSQVLNAAGWTGDFEYCLVEDAQWILDLLDAETWPIHSAGELGSQGGQRRLTIPDRTDWRGNVR